MIKHDWEFHKAGKWSVNVHPAGPFRTPWLGHSLWIPEKYQKFHSHAKCRACGMIVFMNWVPTDGILEILGMIVDCGLVVANQVLEE